MRAIILVLACAICSSHARRVHTHGGKNQEVSQELNKAATEHKQNSQPLAEVKQSKPTKLPSAVKALTLLMLAIANPVQGKDVVDGGEGALVKRDFNDALAQQNFGDGLAQAPNAGPVWKPDDAWDDIQKDYVHHGENAMWKPDDAWDDIQKDYVHPDDVQQENLADEPQLPSFKMVVMEKFKDDMVKILKKEPDRKLFSSNVRMVDSTGAEVRGAASAENLFKLLRKSARKLGANDVQVSFVERHWVETLWRNGKLKTAGGDPYEAATLARWKVQIPGAKKGLFPWSWGKTAPIEFEMEAVVAFDDSNEISDITVSKVHINGKEATFPTVKLSDEKSSLRQIEEWVRRTGEEALESPQVAAAVEKSRSPTYGRYLQELRDELESMQASDLRKRALEDGVLEQDVDGALDLPTQQQQKEALIGYILKVFEWDVPEMSDLEAAVVHAHNDLPKIFSHEPNWHNFADDFTVTDLSGGNVDGLEANKELFRLLRKLRPKLKVKDTKVKFREMNWIKKMYHNGKLQKTYSEPYEPYIVAEWNVQLGGGKGLLNKVLFGIAGSNKPVTTIQAETLLHFDKENKIDNLKINRFLIDDKEMTESDAWPKVELAGKDRAKIKLVQEWLDSVTGLDASDLDELGE